jgi:hypothetical protein
MREGPRTSGSGERTNDQTCNRPRAVFLHVCFRHWHHDCCRKLAHLKRGASAGRLYAVVTKPTPNITRLDPGRPEIASLVDAMLRAREVVASRSWSISQEPTSEHWWADVLADPRARIWQPRGFSGRDGRRTARKSHYRLADEPSPLIEVSCSKCEWKGAFSRAELLAVYGAECPLPSLLNHLAMPGCSKINTHWDRCGVYYVNPIDGRER